MTIESVFILAGKVDAWMIHLNVPVASNFIKLNLSF